jgi:hypothetical protein
MTERSKILFFCLALLASCSPAALAQIEEQERRIEEEERVQVDAAPSHVRADVFSRVRMEYGGWLNYRYNDLDNIDNDKSTADALDSLAIVDARYWLKLTLKPGPDKEHPGTHAVYLRVKDRYVQRSGASPGARYDMDGPHLDNAYTILDYRPLWVEAGRRYFNLGRGIVYSDIHDGIQLNYRKPGFNIGLFTAKTQPHESNIDTSVPGYDKESERYFYGLGVGYTGIKDQSLYAFALAQNDFSNEPNAEQDYTYNSQYFGVGSKGVFFSSWEYWAELIKQTGASRVFGSNERRDVNAWASDAEVAFAPQIKTHPRASVEYAFGSGDADRVSVTDTQSGNTGGRDRNFLYFGYAPTGFALAPRLSNLQMLRGGFEVYPLEHWRALRNLSCGVNYYRFLKHRAQGGISDVEATQNSRDIGQELDLYADWRMLSDLKLSVEYGHFMPGEAYADGADASEDFFSVSVTHTF